MQFTTLSQQLADMPVSYILVFAAVLTVIRLGLIRNRSATARAIVELADAALFASVLMFMIVLPFVVKSFYIPSGSMRETLVDNDHILVNKFLYRLEPPHSRDVVVFTAPPQALALTNESNPTGGPPIDYIKRLIGEPGDVILVHHGSVTIGAENYTHAMIREKLGLSDLDHEHLKLTRDGAIITQGTSTTDPSGNTIFTGTTTRLNKDQLAQELTGESDVSISIDPGYVSRNGVRLREPYTAEDPSYDLKIVNGESYIHDWDQGHIMLDGNQVDGPTMEYCNAQPPGSIPKGEYLVLGDNRNDSNDGSRWGPLDGDRLIGKAFFIFYPFDRIRIIR